MSSMVVPNQISRKLSPIQVLVWYLCVVAVAATVWWSRDDIVSYLTLALHAAAVIGGGAVTQWLLVRFHVAKPSRWEHRAITGLILFLLFDSLTPWWVMLILGIVTELIQRLVRWPTGPVFNPAAAGALAVSLSTSYLPTWWATNFGPRLGGAASLASVITVAGAGYVAHKYRKLPIVVAGLVALTATTLAVTQTSPFFLLVDGTALFFFLVMSVEPKTSPAVMKQQLLYGVGAGVLVVLGLRWLFLEPFLISLLTVNLGFNCFRNRKWLATQLKF